MASLFIKDAETADLAADLAKQLGTTKTQVVRRGLRELQDRMAKAAQPKRKPMAEWIREYREKNPLPPPTGFKADKAFYDSLNDEDDD